MQRRLLRSFPFNFVLLISFALTKWYSFLQSRLYSLLISKISGKAIISCYEAGGLNENSRRKLALLVIEDELGSDIYMKYVALRQLLM